MNLPSVIDTPGGIARFSREVREALSALNRKYIPPVPRVYADISIEGPFYTTYRESADIYLQGGQVTGGNGGTETIEDFKILEAGSPGDNANEILFLRAECKATVADGVLLPGIELLSAALETAETIPPNHSFTVNSDTGDLHLEIGRWTDTVFLRSEPGHAHADGCIGNYLLRRVQPIPARPPGEDEEEEDDE